MKEKLLILMKKHQISIVKLPQYVIIKKCCHSFQFMMEKLPHFSIHYGKVATVFQFMMEKLPQFSIYDGKVATVFNL